MTAIASVIYNIKTRLAAASFPISRLVSAGEAAHTAIHIAAA